MFGGVFYSSRGRFGIGFGPLGVVWESFLKLLGSFWGYFWRSWNDFEAFWIQIVFFTPRSNDRTSIWTISPGFGSRLGVMLEPKTEKKRFKIDTKN